MKCKNVSQVVYTYFIFNKTVLEKEDLTKFSFISGQACFGPGINPAGQGTGAGGLGADIPLQSLGNRGSLVSNASSASKPSALASLANLITDTSRDLPPQRVRVGNCQDLIDRIKLL